MRPRRPLHLAPFTIAVAACARERAACPEAPPHHGGHHAHGGQTPAHRHAFADAERWAREFEAPERDAWQRPDLVVAALALAPDARVADIGAGTGYFAARLARAAPRGRVWAADVEPAMVAWLRERARREQLGNLFATLATAGDPMLPEPVDAALVVDTYHHIEGRRGYFERLRGWLRPGGRVAIVDYRRDSPVGPPEHARVPPEEVRRDLEGAGYAFERSVEGLERQYMLVFRAP